MAEHAACCRHRARRRGRHRTGHRCRRWCRISASLCWRSGPLGRGRAELEDCLQTVLDLGRVEPVLRRGPRSHTPSSWRFASAHLFKLRISLVPRLMKISFAFEPAAAARPPSRTGPPSGTSARHRRIGNDASQVLRSKDGGIVGLSQQQRCTGFLRVRGAFEQQAARGRSPVATRPLARFSSVASSSGSSSFRRCGNNRRRRSWRRRCGHRPKPAG